MKRFRVSLRTLVIVLPILVGIAAALFHYGVIEINRTWSGVACTVGNYTLAIDDAGIGLHHTLLWANIHPIDDDYELETGERKISSFGYDMLPYQHPRPHRARTHRPWKSRSDWATFQEQLLIDFSWRAGDSVPPLPPPPPS